MIGGICSLHRTNLVVALATQTFAGTAPASAPAGVVYYYSDTAVSFAVEIASSCLICMLTEKQCADYLGSASISEVFNKCTEVTQFNSYAIGATDSCDPDTGGFYKSFSFSQSGCSPSSDDKTARGGGCNGQTCVTTLSADGSNDAPASYIIAQSDSVQCPTC